MATVAILSFYTRSAILGLGPVLRRVQRMSIYVLNLTQMSSVARDRLSEKPNLR